MYEWHGQRDSVALGHRETESDRPPPPRDTLHAMDTAPQSPADDVPAAPLLPPIAADVAADPRPAQGPPPLARAAAPILAYRPAADDEWVGPDDRPLRPVMRFLVAGRWVWLSLYVAGALGLAAVVCANEPGAVGPVAVVLVALVGTQALFLVGAPHLRRPRGRPRRAMWVSLAVGGAAAALLTVGLVFTLLNALDWWRPAAQYVGSSEATGGPGPLVLVGAPVLLTWAAWVGVFGLVFAGEGYAWFRGFRRLYATLVAGTFLELLVTIPVDAQVRKRTSCWCDEGTFFALIIGGSMAVWTFGPGIALLFLTRRLQRRRRGGAMPLIAAETPDPVQSRSGGVP